MTVRLQSEIVSIFEARALLGLTGAVDSSALKAAFRKAIKAARPDLPGGDELRFRRTIAAWRLLQAHAAKPPALAGPPARPATLPVVAITPLQALQGGKATVRFNGRTLRVSLAPGLRTGDQIRLKGAEEDGQSLRLPVLIRTSDGLSVIGNDVHMTWPTAPRLIEDGGRVEIQTHAGPRSAWITPGMTGPICLRLRDLGLPARGARVAGHLFVALTRSEDVPSAAEDLLWRFTRVWTPERLAA
ncbi:MAG: molecular chaperone DnaJ [Alphaproteobacteria bacterium]|nr:MAG: molecular chaperone DnaJ [Alphaproteobacteria bacterium]PZO39505.1 MAG: molecular chaperone DnaJ [Alphaproteobacteria bacterium]